MQRLVEAEDTLVTQRTKATEDLRVVHEEFGKLQTSAEKLNKHDTALAERFTELERVQPGRLERLTSQAAMLAQERDTENGLSGGQRIDRTKK